ncbi:MAG TPA: hypothetical protein VH595_21170 [Verrucomicrobiae bacterium]|jgi:hypothetical protein|nr:hypothetical protein [Verrucomicrobiae bacterium]
MRRLFLICCVGALLAGCKGGGDKDDKAAGDHAGPADFEVQHGAAGETVVMLSPNAQKRIDLQVAPLRAAEFQPEVTAYGVVIDSASLLALEGEIAAAQATLETSRKVADRAKALFAQGQNVSQKTMESAESDEQVDEIKLGTAQRGFELEWGTNIAGLDAAARGALVDELAAHQTALAQVDLPIGVTIAQTPPTAQVTISGRDGGHAATIISPALKADPKMQGQGFLLRVDGANAELAPGTAVTARLKIPGAPVAGVAIPDTAIVRFEGKTWVYVAGPENKFTRRMVTVDAPLDKEWFSTNAPAIGERVVVQAAELLLSEEQQGELRTD